MTIAISPIHTSADFPDGMTLDNKIDVFAARVEGWQLGIAQTLVDNDIEHSDFAKLHIVLSLFETLGKYKAGFVKDGESIKHFKLGMEMVYGKPDQTAKEFINEIYKYIRCGMYHMGLTGSKVLIYNGEDIQGTFVFDTVKDQIIVSPNRLITDLLAGLRRYIVDLKVVQNTGIRKKFEKRFDHDNS
jgi:hypothetical protein